jgi:DNA polymerase elongation subunit (family B)
MSSIEAPNKTKFKVRVTPHGIWKGIESDTRRGQCVVVSGKPWVALDGNGKRVRTLTLTQPHVHVLHKIRERGGDKPKVGDRVSFVFVKNAKAKLQIEQAEDPAHVDETGAEVDSLHYFEHALRNALSHVLDTIQEKSYERLMQREHLTAKNKRKGMQEITGLK